MSGMNRFLRQGGKNKLVFDAVSAKRAGYSDRDLKIVSSQIRLMNMLLSEGQAILHPDGSLSLRYYASEGSSRTLARGINRMVIQWYGVFEYWLDSDKARGLISEMKMGRLLPDDRHRLDIVASGRAGGGQTRSRRDRVCESHAGR